MFLSDLSIKRPVLATVMMLTLVTLGLFSYTRLSIDMFPDVEIPMLSIVTVYPGASPETVEREVTRIIEEAVNPISGVKHLMSVSRESVSSIVIEFDLEVGINDASQEARAKINAVRNDLPREMEESVIQKIDFNAMPIVSLAIRSAHLPPKELTTLADRRIKRRIENISGVGKVQLVGASKREVQILIDPYRLQALQLGVNEIIQGLQGENVNTPLGRLNRDEAEVTVRIAGKPDLVRQFEEMVVARRGNHPIPLKEVATVVDGIEEQRSLALIDGIPAVTLDVLKQSKANTVAVVDAVITEIERLKAELPPGVAIDLVRDSAVMIRDSVHDVRTTLIIGGLLTVLIVFCFLNSWRSTIITGLTLPISTIASFIVMYFLDMTLNVMTLMALSLAIGLLIDDAIIVRENIVRHLEQGKDHFTAAREGTAEIGLAVVATTLSIVAVFVPVAFMKGVVGRFFFQFGMTVAFAVMVSLLASFTLDPMLSSRWHDPDIERKGRRNFVSRGLDRFNDGFEWFAERFRGVTAWSLDHRKTIVALAVGALGLGLGLFGTLESEFMPPYDHGEFLVRFKTAPGASIEETRDRMQVCLEKLASFREIHHTYGSIAARESDTVRDAVIYVKLVDKAQRQRTQKELLPLIRNAIQGVAGIQISIEDDPDALIKPFEIRVRGEEIARLKHYAALIKEELYQLPGIVDIEVSMEHDLPEYRLLVKRARAVTTGVTTAQIASTLTSLVGGLVVSTYEDEEGEGLDVRVRLPDAVRRDLNAVLDFRLAVHSPTGRPTLIPIADVAHIEHAVSPSEISRRDLMREVVISANLEGLPLGSASAIALSAAEKVQMAPGYAIAMSGDTEIMEESFRYLVEALLLAIILVYLILAAQFESFVQPLSIMLSLPLSIVGMAGMLALTGDTINIMSLIGLILLVGLVTKNAILLIDFTNVLRRRGVPRREALVTAGRLRLRPIFMTTAAMIFGMLPLALAIGQGAEMRAPMARAVIGGLITSTLLTLVVVPVAYSLLDDLVAYFSRRRTTLKESRP